MKRERKRKREKLRKGIEERKREREKERKYILKNAERIMNNLLKMVDHIKPSLTLKYNRSLKRLSIYYSLSFYPIRYHAFNVAQMMFAMLLKTGWNRMFSEVNKLGLVIQLRKCF